MKFENFKFGTGWSIFVCSWSVMPPKNKNLVAAFDCRDNKFHCNNQGWFFHDLSWSRVQLVCFLSAHRQSSAPPLHRLKIRSRNHLILTFAQQCQISPCSLIQALIWLGTCKNRLSLNCLRLIPMIDLILLRLSYWMIVSAGMYIF